MKRPLTKTQPKRVKLIKIALPQLKQKLRPIELQLSDLNARESYALNLMMAVCQRIITIQKLLDVAPKSPYQDIAGAYRSQIDDLTREACTVKVHMEKLHAEMSAVRASALAILEGK